MHFDTLHCTNLGFRNTEAYKTHANEQLSQHAINQDLIMKMWTTLESENKGALPNLLRKM